jgi:hypothetical protein
MNGPDQVRNGLVVAHRIAVPPCFNALVKWIPLVRGLAKSLESLQSAVKAFVLTFSLLKLPGRQNRFANCDLNFGSSSVNSGAK